MRDWDKDEPCWGKVTPYDDDMPDGEWSHYCEGHRDIPDGGKYISQPTEAPK